MRKLSLSVVVSVMAVVLGCPPEEEKKPHPYCDCGDGNVATECPIAEFPNAKLECGAKTCSSESKDVEFSCDSDGRFAYTIPGGGKGSASCFGMCEGCGFMGIQKCSPDAGPPCPADFFCEYGTCTASTATKECNNCVGSATDCPPCPDSEICTQAKTCIADGTSCKPGE